MREYPSDNVYLNPAITQSLSIDLPAQAWPINQYLLPPLVLNGGGNGEGIIIDIPPLPPIPNPPPISTPDVPPVVPVPIFIIPDPQGKNDPNSGGGGNGWVVNTGDPNYAGGGNGWVVDTGDPNPVLVPIVILPDVPPNNDTPAPEDVDPEWEPTTVTPIWPTPDPSNPNQGSPAPSPVPPQVIDWGGGGGGDTPEPDNPVPDPVPLLDKCWQGTTSFNISDLMGTPFYDELKEFGRIDCCGGRGYPTDRAGAGIGYYLALHPEFYDTPAIDYYPCGSLQLALNENQLTDCPSCDTPQYYDVQGFPMELPPPRIPCSALRSLIIQRPRQDDPNYSCYYQAAFISHTSTMKYGMPGYPPYFCDPYFCYKRHDGP